MSDGSPTEQGSVGAMPPWKRITLGGLAGAPAQQQSGAQQGGWQGNAQGGGARAGRAHWAVGVEHASPLSGL